MVVENPVYDWNVANKNMRKIRLKHRMSNRKLVKELGVYLDFSNVCRYETGRHEPKVEYVLSFCEYFNITLDDLFRENLL